MRRAQLAFVACLSFLLVISEAFWKKALAVSLCSLLFFNSAACHSWFSHRAYAAVSSTRDAQLSDSENEVAIPPIIRDAPIDLQGSLVDDFVVSQQTPYSSGRNEVLIVSPSTGTEQRFEINLPGTGDFRLYEASFSNVAVPNPNEVLGDGSTLSSAQIRAQLSSFKLKFSNNEPSSATLADGTTATFSGSETVIRSAGGQVIETVPLSGATAPLEEPVARTKSFQVAQAGGSCQVGIRDRLYAMSQRVKNKSIDLNKATSAEAKLLAWVLTFGTTALEDSLVADTRNQTLQQVACQAPVQCNAPQSYNGGWETRTDLFELPGGNNGVTLQYEFFQIPDRIELWRDGQLLFSRGPASGNDSVDINDSRLNGTGYVGVKVIGNPTNQSTLWNYTISCEGKPVIAACVPNFDAIPINSDPRWSNNPLVDHYSFSKKNKNNGLSVYIVGSPSPNDGNPYQFLNAAKYDMQSNGNALLLIEKTGYELRERKDKKVSVAELRESIGSTRFQWIEPTAGKTLVDRLNQLQGTSISNIQLYSHGLVGQITLRYGWEDEENPHSNYGLTFQEIDNLKLRENTFSSNANISLNSCNSGTLERSRGSIAERLASRLNFPVNGWTGRTSYREINDGFDDGNSEVVASRIFDNQGGMDKKEFYSQFLRGRVPYFKKFQPDGFSSFFAIRFSMQSRSFFVPKGASVKVKINNYNYYHLNPSILEPVRLPQDGDQISIELRKDSFIGSSRIGRNLLDVGGEDIEVWKSLEEGTYHLTINHVSSPEIDEEVLHGSIKVSIEENL